MFKSNSYQPLSVPPLVRSLVALCRLEAGPQVLSASIVLLRTWFAAYVLARLGVALFTLPPRLALQIAGVDAVCLMLTVYGALRLRGLGHRVNQTLSACFAVGVIISVLTILGYGLVSLGAEPLLLLGVGHVLTFPLILWNLLLNAHILREALSSHISVGFGLALLYLIVLWQISEHLVSTATMP